MNKCKIVILKKPFAISFAYGFFLDRSLYRESGTVEEISLLGIGSKAGEEFFSQVAGYLQSLVQYTVREVL